MTTTEIAPHSLLGTLLRLPGFLNQILQHPLNRGQKIATLWRYLAWHIGSRIVGHPVLYPFVNNLRIRVSAGQWGATGVVYCGLEEFEDMAFCAHLLRSEDLFVDVGANYGTFSLLASGVSHAKTVAFEPNPKTLIALTDNLKLNDLLNTHVSVIPMALGDRSGTVILTDGLQGGDHILTEPSKSEWAHVEVNQSTMDEQLAGQHPALLKIDVEGYESTVIRGAGQTLKSESLLACIIEEAGLQRRYGDSEDNLHQKMLSIGFRSYQYDPFTRELTDLDGGVNPALKNTLYIRDVGKVKERLRSAPKFSVRDHLI